MIALRVHHAIVPAILVLLAAGCERPLRTELPQTLHRALVESVRREIESLPSDSEPRRTTQPPDRITEPLARHLEELEAMAGSGSYEAVQPPPSVDLTGRDQAEVAISLEEAIHTSVVNNLSVQIARIQPAVSEADIVAAEAAFDAVFFVNAAHTRIDEPSTTPVLGGIRLGTPLTVSERTELETGIRKPLITGGAFTVSTRLDRSSNKTPGFALSPDPAYFARISLGIEQPLLRGFGSNVNRARIHLARNTDRRSIQQLRTTLLDLVQEAESAYWDLVVARRTLLIQQRLLERGVEVRDRIGRRRIRETSNAQYADAVATVEQRRASVIRAERRVRSASDQLKMLMNDPALTVGSEALLRPIDFMVEAPLTYNLRDALVTAVDRRPEIHEAVLDLDDRAIGVTLADNARLPLLDLSARMEYIGLDDSAGDAFANAGDNEFIDYFLTLVFEQPIGNRAAQAGYRRARLEQSAAVLTYRRAVQDVVLEVKSALRDLVTNYQLIEATRSARLAQTENLRALRVEQDQRTGLESVQLNLLLQRQEGLALAEVLEINALANYNKAVARLYRAMGVGLDMNGIELAPPQE